MSPPSLSLSFSPFPFPNDFKVVAGNRFANPWRRRIGAFRTPAPRFHLAHNSTSTLSLFPPLVIYNRFSPFFAPTIPKSRLPCKLVPSLLLPYIIIHGSMRIVVPPSSIHDSSFPLSLKFKRKIKKGKKLFVIFRIPSFPSLRSATIALKQHTPVCQCKLLDQRYSAERINAKRFPFPLRREGSDFLSEK